MEEIRDLHHFSIGILRGDNLGLGLDHALPGAGEGDSGSMESPGGWARQSPMTGQRSCWLLGSSNLQNTEHSFLSSSSQAELLVGKMP